MASAPTCTAVLAGGRVSAITRFESAVLSRFGLPRTLPVVP
jgi:hypothetical protein